MNKFNFADPVLFKGGQENGFHSIHRKGGNHDA